MFWSKHENSNKNDINSAEYDRCLKRISELNARIDVLNAEIEILKTGLANLRGQFNRKLSGIRIEEQKQEEPKDINNGELIPLG